MSQTFELWDVETANLIGVYETREAALEVVSRSLVTFGARAIQTLALTAENGEESRTIARAEELIEMADRVSQRTSMASWLTS
jgi:hypothetical protein